MSDLCEFDNLAKEFPHMFDKLIKSKKHDFIALTTGDIRKLFGRHIVSGVYLFTNGANNPIYVGRSGNMAIRVGKDHKRGNLTDKIATIINGTKAEAKEYMDADLYVQMIEIESEYARALFEIYAAMKLNTPFNSFKESK